MAYNEKLARRVRRALSRKDLSEKKMFGGIAFMLSGQMCCGVIGDDLVVRVGPDAYDEVLRKPEVRPMDFTGKPMRGLVYVGPAGTKRDPALKRWVDRGLEYVKTLPG